MKIIILALTLSLLGGCGPSRSVVYQPEGSYGVYKPYDLKGEQRVRVIGGSMGNIPRSDTMDQYLPRAKEYVQCPVQSVHTQFGTYHNVCIESVPNCVCP